MAEKTTTESYMLRFARSKTGYTQQQIADMAGVSRNTVCRWERGERMRRYILMGLLEKMGVDPASIPPLPDSRRMLPLSRDESRPRSALLHRLEEVSECMRKIKSQESRNNILLRMNALTNDPHNATKDKEQALIAYAKAEVLIDGIKQGDLAAQFFRSGLADYASHTAPAAAKRLEAIEQWLEAHRPSLI